MEKRTLRILLGLMALLLCATQALAAPAPPASLTLPTSPDADGIYALAWAKVTGCSYVLEESKDLGAFAPIYAGTATYYFVPKRGVGSYRYQVKSVLSGVSSLTYKVGASPVVVGVTGVVLGAPTYLTVPASTADTKVGVAFGGAPAGATYILEQSTNGGTFTQILAQTFTSNTGYFYVSGLVDGNDYAFRVKARMVNYVDSVYFPASPTTLTVALPQGAAACATCHDVAGPGPVVAAAWGASRHANGNRLPGVTGGSCDTCHNLNNVAGASVAQVGCQGCHGTGAVDHAAGAYSATVAIASCAKCHNSHISADASIASNYAASVHATSALATANAFDTSKCVVCHDPHSANVPTTTICTGCHTTNIHAGSLPDCFSCHDPHSLATNLTIPPSDLPVKLSAHANPGQVAVSNVVVTTDGTNVTMTYNVKVDGVNADNFTFTPAGYWYKASVDADGTVTTGTPTATYPITEDFTRVSVAPTSVASNGSGIYTATWVSIANNTPTGVATLNPKIGNVTFVASAYNGPVPVAPATRLEVTAVGYLNGNPRDVASNTGCINCHGNHAFQSGSHHGANPQGVEACVVCHTRGSSVSRGAGGDRTTAYVHGIHASEQTMDGYDRQFPVKDGIIDFKVSYPTYMLNCEVCHSTPAQLTLINAAPVSYSLCFSCHDAWANFDHGNTVFGGEDHATFDWTENCASCHDGSTAPATVSGFHNLLQTARSGIIYNGQDISVIEGVKVDMQITGASRSGANLLVTWTTKYNNGTVNPCNAVATTNNPAFHAAAANAVTGQVAGGFSILRAYAQGDDFSNPGIGTAPGQPASTNLTTGNTACIANVATSTIALSAAEQAMTRGEVSIQGKAQVKLAFDYDLITAGTQDVDQVRSKSPTREVVVADGSLPLAQRRAIIDTAGCLKCHPGSLYQHGGNRVDNVDLCVMCHNEASNEQNVRVFDGVSASEAYDGKAGMTYGFKSLLHAVHSANENGAITMIHRTNGNYVWTGEATTVIPHYPTQDVFADAAAFTVSYWINDDPTKTAPVGAGAAALVYGSSAPLGTGPQTAGTLAPPVFSNVSTNANYNPAYPAGTTYTAGTYYQVYRSHNLFHPTYPQPLKNCVACHKPGTFGLPDATKAVATTVNVGGVLPDQSASTGAVYGGQTDDTLQGPAAAACMSCHSSSDAVLQGKLTVHANQGGFAPAVLPNGRDAVLNGSTSEYCSRCHE